MAAGHVVERLGACSITQSWLWFERARSRKGLLGSGRWWGVGATKHAHGQEKRISVSAVVVQFKIHMAGVLNRPVGNYRHASPYSYGFQ